jgi:hypothetical protein
MMPKVVFGWNAWWGHVSVDYLMRGIVPDLGMVKMPLFVTARITLFTFAY